MAGKTVAMIAKQNYEALLMDYAAGTLNEAQSLIVASHLTLSPFARRIVEDCEAIGGSLLDCQCDPIAMKSDSLADVLDRLESEQEEKDEPVAHSTCEMLDSMKLPRPVQNYIHETEYLPWKKVYPGMQSYEIKTKCRNSKVRLLKIDPGTKTPEHSHAGTEITLMIDGAAHDESGTYSRGDLIVMDERITHQPVADEKMGCFCLVVNSDPIRLTGWMGKILNPFLSR
ncbi:MAG: ChrR family anti-sigma-E factor [Pseudomonadota bacterium]